MRVAILITFWAVITGRITAAGTPVIKLPPATIYWLKCDLHIVPAKLFNLPSIVEEVKVSRVAKLVSLALHLTEHWIIHALLG